MNRRQFLKHMGVCGAGLAVSGSALHPITEIAAAELPQTMPILSVAEGADYHALVSTVLAPLGGIGAFVEPGYRVVVKPNIGWDRSPEQAANTHPEVVKALAQLALEAGASQVQVFDRPCNEQRRCYANSGIQGAVESLNDGRATCTFIDDRKFVLVAIEQGRSLKEFTFYKDALEADCYINVPIAKHHSGAGLTLSLKNAMGIIGGNRGEIHAALGQRIADLNAVIRPHLNVIDATRILLNNGPSGGNLDDVQVMNTLIASTDPIAADAYATNTLFGLQPQDIESTRAGYELGLGEIDLSKVDIVYANTDTA
jgi:uncharacterized protein (DUF362 family)